MRYWDTSVLVPLLVEEPESPRVRDLLKEDPLIVTWWATPVEIFSALCRYRREDGLPDDAFATVRVRFTELLTALDLVAPNTALRNKAIQLLTAHPLRSADALQLAAALRWCRGEADGMTFVAFDGRLRKAAAREGFAVLP